MGQLLIFMVLKPTNAAYGKSSCFRLPFKSLSEIVRVSYFNSSQNVSAHELAENWSHTVVVIIPVTCRNPAAQAIPPG